MTGKELRKLLVTIEMSQSAFARHLERSDRVVRSWISGDIAVPHYAELIANQLLIEHRKRVK
jgi:DNA-binding transcriptional regulator YiaG